MSPLYVNPPCESPRDGSLHFLHCSILIGQQFVRICCECCQHIYHPQPTLIINRLGVYIFPLFFLFELSRKATLSI